MTFEPHPLRVLKHNGQPPLITLYEQKIELMKRSGLDVLICVPFTPEFAAMSAKDFVEDLLELARLDAPEVRPEQVPFQLAELVQDVVLQFRDRSHQMEIQLQSDVPRSLPLVKGDIALLERVLVNLIENALQFTPAGGSVTVVARCEEDTVTVGVEDTGCGIPPEDVPRVFDRFYRVEKSRSRGEGGTGLGLAIASRITELHGSTLQLESQPDQGSRFSFSLAT